MSCPNPIPPMTEEERAAFRSFLLRRYVLSILALVLGIAGAVLLLRRGADGPPLMEAVWGGLFVLSGGTAVLGGRAWGRYQTLLTEPEAMERTWQARRAGPQTEADQSYRRDVSRSGRLGLLLLAAAPVSYTHLQSNTSSSFIFRATSSACLGGSWAPSSQ